MPEIILKPCPFCGSKPVMKSDYRYPRPSCKRLKAYEVVCQNYDCIIYNADNSYELTPKAAVEKWNKRVANDG